MGVAYYAELDTDMTSRGFATEAAARMPLGGGRLSIWHADGEGNDVGGSESEIIELVPGERIVLRWQFVGPDRTTDPAMATRLTVTFTPKPDGTQLDLSQNRLDGIRDRYPHIAEPVAPGWESALDMLVAGGW